VSSAQYMQEEIIEGKTTEDHKTDDISTEIKEGESEVKKEVPKTKYKAIELEVVSTFFGQSKEQIKASLELEASMTFEDQLIVETSDRRNELEAYIYAMRDKIDSSLSTFSTSEEKSNLKTLLTEAEDWLYNDGFDSTKQMYIRKIDELKALGNPIEFRASESANRTQTSESLKKQADLAKTFAANFDDAHAHITDEERSTITSATQSAEKWLAEQTAKQANLPDSVNPILTCEQISARRNQLFSACNPIMTKPKPKPKPAPETKEEKPAEDKEGDKSHADEDKNTEGAANSEKESDPMEM
jgi:heat shock protein 4